MSTEKLSPLQTELLSRADSIFASISSTVNKASDFAVEQIPEVALQYVAFGRVYLSLMVGVALVMLIVSMFGFIYSTIKYNASKTGENWDFLAGVCLITAIISCVVALVNTKELIMVWFAPKIWLMTEIVHLVK